jgi:hypothetical protein
MALVNRADLLTTFVDCSKPGRCLLVRGDTKDIGGAMFKFSTHFVVMDDL